MGDLGEITGGGTPSSSYGEYWDGEIDWFTPTEVTNAGFLGSSKRKITKLGLSKSSAKLLRAGSVLITSRAGVGNMGILTHAAATNQGFQSLTLKSNISPYLFYSMQPIISRLANRLAAGSTFTEISGKEMAKVSINISNVHAENEKLSHFFYLCDTLIAANERAPNNMIAR